MTDAEKKMKHYTAAVARRLNLPRDLKQQVMGDFASSIQARRDAGKTDAEIYCELGSPRKAAAALNEQMKEYTYRKSPWRYLFGVCAVYGAGKLLDGLWAYILYLFLPVQAHISTSKAVSVGIIGGADGPTAIFLTTPAWFSYIIPLILVVVGTLGFIRLSKCKRG